MSSVPPYKFSFMIVEDQKAGGEEPRMVKFEAAEVTPLSYQDLQKLKTNEPITMRLVCRNLRILESNIRDVDLRAAATISMNVKATYASRAIALVRGGWLPLAPFTFDDQTTIFIDRNVVSQVVARFKAGASVVSKGEPDFMDLIGDYPVRLNPVLCAIEGNVGDTPTANLVQAQLLELKQKLSKALPKASLIIGEASLLGAIMAVDDTRIWMTRARPFLIDIAPQIVSPVSRSNFDRLWERVLAAADKYDLPRSSIVVFAALSSIAVPNGKSVAKRIIKPKGNYAPTDAYNALMDFRALEYFASILAHFPDHRAQLFTADRSLALLWAGLRASNFTGSHTDDFDIAPVPELMPEQFGERWMRDIG